MKGLKTLIVDVRFTNQEFMADLRSLHKLFASTMHKVWGPLELVQELNIFDVLVREFEGRSEFLEKLWEWAGDEGVPYRFLAGGE